MKTSKNELKERFSTFTSIAAFKLRKQNSNCELIQIHIISNRFRQDLPQYYGYKTVSLPYPTSSTFIINKYAQKALDDIFKEGIHYKKSGVVLMGITQDSTQQLSMFEYEDPKHKILMKVMDSLNVKLGEKVKFASMDLNNKWMMKRQYLSKAYSTNLDDIITVNC